jgi:hypothetical protein
MYLISRVRSLAPSPNTSGRRMHAMQTVIQSERKEERSCTNPWDKKVLGVSGSRDNKDDQLHRAQACFVVWPRAYRHRCHPWSSFDPSSQVEKEKVELRVMMHVPAHADCLW